MDLIRPVATEGIGEVMQQHGELANAPLIGHRRRSGIRHGHNSTITDIVIEV
jgi:hypothetical protein